MKLAIKLKALIALIVCICLLCGASSIYAADAADALDVDNMPFEVDDSIPVDNITEINDTIDDTTYDEDFDIMEDEHDEMFCLCSFAGLKLKSTTDSIDAIVDNEPNMNPEKIRFDASFFVVKDFSSLNASSSFDLNPDQDQNLKQDLVINPNFFSSKETLSLSEISILYNSFYVNGSSLISRGVVLSNDFTYSYNDVQNNAVQGTYYVPRDLNEDEITKTKSSNFMNILVPNCIQVLDESTLINPIYPFSDHDTFMNVDSSTLNGVFPFDFVDTPSLDFTSYDFDMLHINLCSDELDIVDYNLEYSIIANPHLNIEVNNAAVDYSGHFTPIALSFNNGVMNEPTYFNTNKIVTEAVICNNSIFYEENHNIISPFNQELLFANDSFSDVYEELSTGTDQALINNNTTSFCANTSSVSLTDTEASIDITFFYNNTIYEMYFNYGERQNPVESGSVGV